MLFYFDAVQKIWLSASDVDTNNADTNNADTSDGLSLASMGDSSAQSNSSAQFEKGAQFDRGLQFGDGVFETLRLNCLGQSPLLALHRERCLEGVAALRFSPTAIGLVEAALDELPAQLVRAKEAIAAHSGTGQEQEYGAKLIVTRGQGPRGYGASTELKPTILLTLFSTSPLEMGSRLRIGVSDVRLGRQPLLAGHKHLNRLEQVLARQSFAADWHEALMLSDSGEVIEGCMSNVFVKHGNEWLTPELTHCGVRGVVRQWWLNPRGAGSSVKGQSAKAVRLSLDDVLSADALVMTNSLMGVRPVSELLLPESGDVTLFPDQGLQDADAIQQAYGSLFDITDSVER
ncbi:MAG: aminodeoxychorismate lyase [Pseudomonadota bacterium]|nr:aminodeoxychorismate lyase [Pseudomonadota bacterium]